MREVEDFLAVRWRVVFTPIVNKAFNIVENFVSSQ